MKRKDDEKKCATQADRWQQQQSFVVTLQSNGLLSCIIGFIQIHEDEVGNKDKAVDSLSVHTLTCSFIKKD